MRHKLPGVTSGTFHPKSHHQISTFTKALVGLISRAGRRKSWHLVTISHINSFNTRVEWHLIFTRPAGLYMKPDLKKCHGVNH